jgi:NAD-dependent deacetylase
MTTQQVRAKIAASSRICGFTGAGISTESGIPDFRSPGGVWSKYRTVYFDEFISSREARVEYWRQKVENWPHIRDAQPNAGHFAFAQLERDGHLRAMITQNIDGLHQKAGSSRDMVIELHGTTVDILCLDCGDRTPSEEAIARVAAGDLAPQCRLCGGYLKPATISFGQAMPEEEMRRASAAAADCDVFIAAGSSLGVQPAAGFPALAKSRGAALVIVNRDPTPLDDIADLVIHDEIGRVLPDLLLTLERL